MRKNCAVSFVFVVLLTSFYVALAQQPETEETGRYPNYLSRYSELKSTGQINRANTGDSLNVRLLGRWANGPCFTGAIVGDTAYFGNGGYLEVVDFSNPAQPVELAKLETPSVVEDVIVEGNYAYVANGKAGLRIIDVSQPDQPTETGFYDTGDYAYGVYVSGSTAYVADKFNGLRIIDASQPDQPTEIGFYDTGDIAYDVYVSGTTAYVADGYDGLRVIDVSEPSQPTEIGFYDTENCVYDVFVSGNTAYVADGYDGLRLIDVSQPGQPTEIGFYDTENCAYGVFFSVSTAYVANGYDGLRLIDVSQPGQPTEIEFYDTGDIAYDVYVSRTTAYVADGNDGLRVIDVSQPAQIEELGFFETRDCSYDVAVSGGYAYVANAEAGLRVIDMSTPTNPIEVGFSKLSGRTWGVTLSGSYAYLANEGGGLRIVDVSQPTQPVEVGFLSGGDARGVTISGNVAYVANHGYGLWLIDISQPTQPVEIGSFDTDGYSFAVAVEGNYAYVADGNKGLRIIDVSQPTQPNEIGFYDTDGYTKDVSLSGDYAFVADAQGGLQVIDVSIPDQPLKVGFYKNCYANGVVVLGDYAFVAGGSGGLRVIDVSQPTQPIEIRYYFTGSLAYDVAVSGNCAYVADMNDGLYIFEVSQVSPHLPDHWNFTANTGNNATVVLPDSINPNIDGVTLANDDYIGVFTPTGLCCGYNHWEGQNIAITVWGDNNQTPDIDGFQASESISYRVYRLSEENEWASVAVDYSQGNGVYSANAFMVLSQFDVVTAQVMEQDSLALVALYNSTDGSNWTDNTNWLSGPVSTWFGITVSGGCVTRVELSNNNLIGKIPPEIGNLTDLTYLGLYVNQLTDLTDLSSITTLTDLLIQNNKFTFEDIEPNVGVPNFVYSPQDSVGTEQDTTVTQDSSLVLSVSVGGTANQYQWFKDRVEIIDSDSSVYMIETVDLSDSGVYACQITNTIAPQLTLYSLPINVHVTPGVGVSDRDGAIPDKFALLQNYPNPFNPETRIEYHLSQPSEVKLVIYDVRGQVVRELIQGVKPAGYYEVIWDIRNSEGQKVAAGIYVYRIEIKSRGAEEQGFIDVKKMVLMK